MTPFRKGDNTRICSGCVFQMAKGLKPALNALGHSLKPKDNTPGHGVMVNMHALARQNFRSVVQW